MERVEMSYPIVVGPKTVTITGLTINKTASGEGTITGGTYKITDTSGGTPPPPKTPGADARKAMGDAATVLLRIANSIEGGYALDTAFAMTGITYATAPAVPLGTFDAAAAAAATKAATDAATTIRTIGTTPPLPTGINVTNTEDAAILLEVAAYFIQAGFAYSDEYSRSTNHVTAFATIVAIPVVSSIATSTGFKGLIDNLRNNTKNTSNLICSRYIADIAQALLYATEDTPAAATAGTSPLGGVPRSSRETFLGGKRRSTRQNRKASSRKTRSHGRR